MRRFAVVSSASGSGKTTVGRELARRLDIPFVELDELNHGPNWIEASSEDLRARVEPIVEGDSWVVDGGYQGKLGDLVLQRADVVVWLDLPMRVWLPRLLRRTLRRVLTREELWAGNRETIRDAIWGRDALIPFAVRHFRRRRRLYPARFERFHVVRLRTPKEVERWLATFG